jgi:aspartate kinase
MEIIVQKFGGTSVGDLERIKNAASIVKSEISRGNQVVAVVSAMAGVTNSLISKCNQVSKLDNAHSLREYDAAIASGEIITSALLALQLQENGIKAKSMQGWQIPIKTNNIHSNAQALEISSSTLKAMLDKGITPVITGFQGITDGRDITTLGKGGSDTSAAIIAASLQAHRCDIYTDVDGIYSADPRVVHEAQKLDSINIDELCALCSAGAKVLHPRAALAAKRYGFNLRILSSFNSNEGTIVETKTPDMEKRKITAITSNKNLLKIDISQQKSNLTKVIKGFSNNAIQIEQTNIQNDANSYVITNLSDKAKCTTILEKLKNNSEIVNYTLNTNISSVTIVGYGIKNDSNLTWQAIEKLDQNGIQIISSQASDIKISFLINDQDNEKAIKLLHESFF